MAITKTSYPTRKRILSTCVRLFLEQGYKRTTLAEIVEKADVSFSSFQNIFRAKDGVLTELVDAMFVLQFPPEQEAGALPPLDACVVDAAIQLTLTEQNENLREVYTEAYTQREALSRIHERMMPALQKIFQPYMPEADEAKFYALEVGSAALMRGFISEKCTESFTLEKKINTFLTMSMGAYGVPEEEQQRLLAYVASLDIHKLAEEAMYRLFNRLSVQYEFSLKTLVPQPKRKEMED